MKGLAYMERLLMVIVLNCIQQSNNVINYHRLFIPVLKRRSLLIRSLLILRVLLLASLLVIFHLLDHFAVSLLIALLIWALLPVCCCGRC